MHHDKYACINADQLCFALCRMHNCLCAHATGLVQQVALIGVPSKHARSTYIYIFSHYILSQTVRATAESAAQYITINWLLEFYMQLAAPPALPPRWAWHLELRCSIAVCGAKQLPPSPSLPLLLMGPTTHPTHHIAKSPLA